MHLLGSDLPILPGIKRSTAHGKKGITGAEEKITLYDHISLIKMSSASDILATNFPVKKGLVLHNLLPHPPAAHKVVILIKALQGSWGGASDGRSLRDSHVRIRNLCRKYDFIRCPFELTASGR